MRATLGQFAVVMLVAIGVSGCTSSGSNRFAFWKRKPADSATEAPKFNATAGNSALPSSGQNPNASLASVQGSAWQNTSSLGAANATTAASANVPSAYQNPAYPSTGYGQTKLANTTATSASSTSPWGATSNYGKPASSTTVPAYNVGGGATVSGTASGGVTNTGYGYSAANTTSPSAYSNPTVNSSNPTAYSANPAATAAVVQPQTGFYNPPYDGGTATRYASGAAIPGTGAATMPEAASAMGQGNYTAAGPSYRMADVRGAAAAAAAGAAGMDNTPYTNNAGNYTSAGGYTNSASPYINNQPGYSSPSSDYRPASTGYDPGATGYQPGVTTNPPGNTGYNPPDAYSTSPAAGTPAGAGVPARRDPGYRPGGTGNYMPPAGNALQPGSTNATQPENRSQYPGVMPANYQAADSGAARSSAAAAGPVEVYGNYQGAATGDSNNASAAAAPSRNW